MPPSRRASPRGGSRGRPSGPLWRAYSEWGGSERKGGSPLPTPCTKEKKEARPTDGNSRSGARVWAVGFEDECWWSRVALPTLNAWGEEGKPLRLIQRPVAKDDPEPKA